MIGFCGSDITSRAFIGRNFKQGSIYSDCLSETIKEVMYNQIKKNGYTTKDLIYKEIIIFYHKFKFWEALQKEKQDPKKIFDLEFKRSIGIFLKQDNDLILKKATKELVAVYSLKSYISIIYSKKDFSNRKG